MKKPLIVLTGPTAVGKTKLSIALAKAVNGEIISADSMQVYRHMDIGSAKITPEEMDGVPHHLVDVLEPTEDFNIVLFQQMAKEAMEKIYDKGRIPILVGGTGFYIQAVTRDIDFTSSNQDDHYRRELEELAEQKGPSFLHDMLAQVDPKSAQDIHENNVKREGTEIYHVAIGVGIVDERCVVERQRTVTEVIVVNSGAVFLRVFVKLVFQRSGAVAEDVVLVAVVNMYPRVADEYVQAILPDHLCVADEICRDGSQEVLRIVFLMSYIPRKHSISKIALGAQA